MLDPDAEFALDETEYRLSMIEQCEPHECETEGDPTLTHLSKPEIKWFKHLQKAVVTLRQSYPEYIGKVFCAIQSVLLDPQVCQMHYASGLVSKLNYLVQVDLASNELVKALNKRSRSI